MSDTNQRVLLAGATGWAGSALARGIARAEGLELIAGVSRRGGRLAEHLGPEVGDVPLHADAASALAAAGLVDVFVEYTQPDVATANIAAALDAGCHVVVGTSGLTGQQYDQIDAHARRVGRGVLACGNFALSAVLMMKFSELATRWFPRCEVIDYAGGGKIDAPSGTARELAHRVGRAGASAPEVALDEVQGERDARGAHLDGVQVHSVRLPSFVLAVESIFGATDERLTIRHDAGSSAEPYVGGALLAIQRVGGLIGLARGLDQVLDM